MRLLRSRRTVPTVLLAVTALLIGAPAALAEGPGYGGTAQQLSVTWEAVTPALDAPAALSFGGGVRGVSAAVIIPASDPTMNPDAVALMVRGLGFRGKSTVQVRVGSAAPVTTRADTAGALAVSLDPDQLTGTDPGMSVMAVGRNPSGTEVTLFGSIPPAPAGNGPMTFVPWVALGVMTFLVAGWVRKHRSDRGPSRSDGTLRAVTR